MEALRPIRLGRATMSNCLSKAATGGLIEVDHTTQVARRVPVQTGGRLVIHGQRCIDANRVGVHCTHA